MGQEQKDALECLKVEARTRIVQAAVCWEARLLADLQDRSVNEALLLMIMYLEDEDRNEQCHAQAHTARELMTIGANQQAGWRAQEMAHQRTAVEDEVYAELALWKVSKLEQEKRAHISAVLVATSEEQWAALHKQEMKKAVTKAKETAEVFARANYDSYFIAAQHRLFPNVEELAQQGDEASALAEERECIYPGMREQANAEAKAEAREYRVTRVARLQAEMERSVQEEEITVIREAAAKRGYTLQDAARVPAVKRPQKKPKSRTVREALKESSGPVMGEKRTAEGRSRASSLSVAPVHAPADPDHPMVIGDTSDTSDDTPTASSIRKRRCSTGGCEQTDPPTCTEQLEHALGHAEPWDAIGRVMGLPPILHPTGAVRDTEAAGPVMVAHLPMDLRSSPCAAWTRPSMGHRPWRRSLTKPKRRPRHRTHPCLLHLLPRMRPHPY